MPVEEQQGRLRLSASRARRAVHRQVTQESLDLRRPQVPGMPLAVKEDEPPHPVEVGILRPEAVVPDPQAFPQLIQELGGLHSRSRDPLPTRLPIRLEHGPRSDRLRSPIALILGPNQEQNRREMTQFIVFFSPVKPSKKYAYSTRTGPTPAPDSTGLGEPNPPPHPSNSKLGIHAQSHPQR